MTNDKAEVEEKFYQDVADLLDTQNIHEYNRFTVGRTYRTRWNNRKPGSGRFEGYGLVRYFGPTMIHVALNQPVYLNKVFGSTEEVLEALKKVLDESRATL